MENDLVKVCMDYRIEGVIHRDRQRKPGIRLWEKDWDPTIKQEDAVDHSKRMKLRYWEICANIESK